MAVDFIGPPPRSKNTKHSLIASELQSHPESWGVVQKSANIARASSAAQAIRRGRLSAYLPAGTFEAVARTVVEHGVVEHRVYARYVGGAK
ncbi:hypothetical protein EYS09_09650 [Streptomyces kasugaensis]|uniref:Uncharacterized protein n=1 Tax=Streptomyces kasugaensis TaxID=1946 RepID=A0A4Q9HXA5_STRKA|nr:hypothetical protein [Streptomyces kasugaensis]TBO59873.1 hypothetical protein EYS09_09650 [Streptomyces kasugaensis]